MTDKPLKAIQKEMKDMVRQIISSVTILPHLDDICSFDILAYTDEDIEVFHSSMSVGCCNASNN